MTPRSFTRMGEEEGVMSSRFLIARQPTHTMLPLSGYRPRRARRVPIAPYGAGVHRAWLSTHNRSQVQNMILLKSF